jgi:hypothetical protein
MTSTTRVAAILGLALIAPLAAACSDDAGEPRAIAQSTAAPSAPPAAPSTGLAGEKQMVVVCDHDSKVLARKEFRCRAWDLGAALDWAAARAAGHGFAGVTVACEPTGHRWRVSRGDASSPAGGLAELGAQGVSGRSERLDEDRASVGYLVGKTGQTQRPDVAAGA